MMRGKKNLVLKNWKKKEGIEDIVKMISEKVILEKEVRKESE